MNLIVKLAAVALFASSAALASPHFGIQVGAGLTGFNGDDAKDIDASIGLAVGGTMVMPLGSGLAFNPQVMFAYRTSSVDLDLYTMYINETALEVPLLVRYNVTPAFFLQGGPQLGLVLSSEVEVEDETEDVTDERTKFEYGLAVGAGFQITENWAVDVKYNYGINNSDKDGDGDVTPYQLMLGGSYLF